MKSTTKALKINKISTKSDKATKKTDKAIKVKDVKKENTKDTKINLIETNRNKNNNENLNKANTINENIKKSINTSKRMIKTMYRQPKSEINNISVIQNEPTIKKKLKQEDEITDHSVASKKSIMKDGVLLIDDPKLRKIIEESRRNYEQRLRKIKQGDKKDDKNN